MGVKEYGNNGGRKGRMGGRRGDMKKGGRNKERFKGEEIKKLRRKVGWQEGKRKLRRV